MAKSELHIELARRALVWLEGKATQRGIRGCEEVQLAEGYVADSAAITGLVNRIERAMLGDHYQERRLGNGGWGLTDDYAFVFESKVSRSDFFNTFKRNNHKGDRLSAIGNFHFVVTPKGMLKPEEIPTFWGLLEIGGAGLSAKKSAEYQTMSLTQLHELAYNILRSRHESKFGIWNDEIISYRAIELNLTPEKKEIPNT